MNDPTNHYGKESISISQFKKLKKLVDHTFSNSTFYRKFWSENGFRPKMLQIPSDLKLIPVISRKQLREALSIDPSSVYARKNLPDLHFQTTSGSSGIPLKIYWSKKEWIRRMWFLLRAYRKQGLPLFSTTQNLADPVDIKKPLFFQYFGILKNEYHDIYVDFQEHFDNLSKLKRIQILKGMPSDLFSLAYYVLKNGGEFPEVDIIQSVGEVLDKATREYVESAFSSKILDSYSSVETGLIAYQSTTSDGKYEISSENVILEAHRNDIFPEGDSETVVTNLNNFTTPIIRYLSGDVVKIISDSIQKITIPDHIESIYGKYLDFLVHPDGEIISAHVVKQNLTHIEGIDRFQIEQLSVDKIVITVQPDKKYSNETEEIIRRLMLRDLGEEVQISIRLEENLMAKNDYRKFKVVSSIPALEILDSIH